MKSKLRELITTILAFALLTPVSAQQQIYQDPTYAQVDALIAVAAGKTPPTPTYQQLYMHPTYEQVDRLITTVKAGRSMISATNPTFSNAVLAVNVDFATNTTGAAYVAVTNALAGFGFDADALAELPGGKVYGSIGALLAALAAAVTWLKKKALIGGLTSGVPDDPKVHDFFTNSNSLLTGTIDAHLPYPLYAVPSTGELKDRAINTTSLASVTVPDNFTDLLIRASVETSLAVTMPAETTKYGDTFPGEAGEYLITITKTGATEAYVRTIKLEVANA